MNCDRRLRGRHAGVRAAGGRAARWRSRSRWKPTCRPASRPRTSAPRRCRGACSARRIRLAVLCRGDVRRHATASRPTRSAPRIRTTDGSVPWRSTSRRCSGRADHLLGVRGGRYRTPFGLSLRGDHAYYGFTRAPLIRYGEDFALSNTFMEGGVNVIAGSPRLYAETSLGVPLDEGLLAAQAGVQRHRSRAGVRQVR